ncbi:MAG: fibro-slime domain-containing protein [Fibrobacter sp.]|nr:fibro-slime domain-containing protein [Fibrobacter sp.]
MKSLKILFATAIALSVTNAWADLRKSETSYDVCSPKVHFKLPDNWTTAYLMLAGSGVPFPKADADGWSTIDLGTTKAIDDNSFFINSRNTSACYDGTCFTKKGANTNSQNPRVDGFTCKDVQTDGGNIWIMEHPDPRKAGQVYVKQEKPVVQDFYVLLPQNKMWMSSTPLINENGIDHELYVDTDRCGWYFRRYVDEELPSSVLIHMADDENPYKHAVGMEGENSSNATPIALSAMFSIFEAEPDYKDALYFVVDENIASELPENTKGWFATYPEVEGYCGLELAATIYDTDAQLHPSFSCYSGGYRSQSEGCQATSGTAAQGVDSATAVTAINECIGVTTGIVETTLDSKTKKPTLSALGKKCFIDNKYFNQLFNYTEGVNEKTYFYMPFYRTTDGKWEFDSDKYTSPGLDIPVQGGFYPAEGKTDAKVLAADPKQKPVPAARTKRNAEGPVFWGPLLRELDPSEQVPIIDLFCKGPGWSKGYDCEGSFAEGEETTERINETLKLGTGLIDACVFGWSCDIDGYAPEGWPMFVQGSETASTGNSSYSHRWTSSEENSKGNGGRNQHFCFESHAKFAFKRGLKFSIRGDDDIWVFINNKLAVDLGGTHLSTPGYVDLDFFMKDAKVDSIYDIDVFFCDRRTTMSNMRISTNIYMYQDEEITDLPTSSSSSAKATSNASTKSSDSKNAKSSSSVSGSKSKSSSSTTKDSKSSASKNSKSSSSNKDAKSKSSSSTKYYAKPSFHVEMVAPFEFDIVFDDDTPSLAKQYAVMDMKGQVLFTGELSSADTRVKVPTSGSYIVSVGYNYRQVNVK